MIHTFNLLGRVPPKKNSWKFGRGKVFIPREVQAWLDSLQLQVQSAWRGRRPIQRAAVRARFYVPAAHAEVADLDNAYTALQDVLVKAGVLSGDTMRRVFAFASSVAILPPTAAANEERVVVRVREALP
jgi:Holliday junction resolvase RusA-like endonuclease